MIRRRAYQAVRDALARQTAVALIGARPVGKTTLAHAVAAETDALYLENLAADREFDSLEDFQAFADQFVQQRNQRTRSEKRR